MTKFHSLWVCQQCAYESVGYLGKCPNCGSWNSLVETVIQKEESSSKSSSNKQSKYSIKPISLSSIPSKKIPRTITKISELDRVLGGGLVSGQVVLIAGEPGIGKSTLLLQLANNMGETLYVSGEESVRQIAIRAERLGIKNKKINLLEETDVDAIINSIDSPSVVIIDSIQTMQTGDLSGLAGSVGQVRECTFRLLKIAKEKGISLFIVGHVTKEGTVAGPSVLMHIVDTVLWFEGDKTLTLRLLRAVKNRFGPTDEVGIFEMEDKGLTCLTNAEKIFLTHGRKLIPGSCVTSILQGTRPLLAEIEALVTPCKSAFPKRIAQGLDSRKLELLLAVLIRRCGIPLYDFDVFLNVAAGLKISEPSADLAICLSIASAYYDKPLPKGSIAVGEVGLLGEIREVVAEDKRLKEARRLGYTMPISSKEVNYLLESIKRFIK